MNLFTGIQVGLIVALPLTGFMTNMIGWASPFYLIGGVTCVWFGFWTYLVHNSPDEHPRISQVFLRQSKFENL